MIHATLARQLRKLGLPTDEPPTKAAWAALLEVLSRTYTSEENRRYILERSLEISSREMEDLHAKLAAERDTFDTILCSIEDGLLVLDRQGTITFINPAGARLLGAHSTSQIVGRSLPSLFLTAAEGVDHGLDVSIEIAGAIRESVPLKKDDVFFPRLDGTLFSVSFVLTAMKDKTRDAMVLLFRNINERKQLEISLRHAQKLESLGILASGVAHEINTPIQFVGDSVSFLGAAFSDLRRLIDRYRLIIHDRADDEAAHLADRAFEEADIEYASKEAPAAIENALEGVARVKEIVQAMKSLAHQDRGQLTSANINGAVETTLTIARNEYKYVADVATDLGDIPAVTCFLTDITQVFLNLIINAAHAIADKFETTQERGVIRIKTMAEGSDVVVSVSDTGIGISEEARPHIFDPFFTTKEVGRGSGQGLAIARAVVVDKHKGRLWYETEVGVGTTFFLRIPIETSNA